MEECLLQCNVTLYPKNIEVNVKLSNSAISIDSLSNTQKSKALDQIGIDSIIGCHVLEGNKTTLAPYYLCIFTYPLKRGRFSTTRQRVTRSFGFVSAATNPEKKALAELWKRVIMCLISGRKLTSSEIRSIDEMPIRNFIVYVNPFSGRGNAMKIFHSTVKTMFGEAEIKHEVVKSEAPGHAREMARKLDLKKFNGIITVSGDGLINEIINGLMEREDWETAIKTPLGFVPGGSGNALASSIAFDATGIHPPPSMLVSSVFAICRGNVLELDLMSIEMEANETESERSITYGALGCIFGLISDIDIESERLRFLGQAIRTNIYAVLRIATLRHYHAVIYYLPLHDGIVEEKHIEVAKNERRSEPVHENEWNGTVTTRSVIENHLLEPLDKPLPDSWKVIEGDFVHASALNLSHISEDVALHPDLKLDDGCMKLTMIKSSASRLNMLKYWDLLEKGVGFSETTAPENLLLASCKAFRIVPNPSHSEILTLDGEKIPFKQFQGQIHQRMARVFGHKKN